MDGAIGLRGDVWATDPPAPVLVCVLGEFRLLEHGNALTLRDGGKSAGLLSSLALTGKRGMPRESLLGRLWPDSEPSLANHCLNTVVHGLRRLLSAALGGAAPVLHTGGYYRLNLDAGVGVDVGYFELFASTGVQHDRAGNRASAARYFQRAVQLYQGDLPDRGDIWPVMEAERLRVLYLSSLAWLADDRFADSDYGTCLHYAHRLLASEPCREDAHRLIMRCYVRRGERAQALRQYQVCTRMLREEFAATPEPETTRLYDVVRTDPTSA
jgi:DNA-binding SARP family transcriptional activator